MTNIDRALLGSEWVQVGDRGPSYFMCPSCRRDRDVCAGQHAPDCPHDLALCERAYPDQTSRDRARELLAAATSPTIPPP